MSILHFISHPSECDGVEDLSENDVIEFFRKYVVYCNTILLLYGAFVSNSAIGLLRS